MEKKQRKVHGGKRPLEDPAPANGRKRPRTEMPSQPSQPPQPPQQPQAERKSLGLLARAKAARGLKGEQGSKAPLGKVKTAKADKAKAKVAVERPKDPYLLAEEEELKYLERKLGLTGACEIMWWWLVVR